MQRGAADLGVDAGDKETFAAAVLEQAGGFLDAGLAAGEDDDAVGALVTGFRLSHDGVGEQHEAEPDDEQRQSNKADDGASRPHSAFRVTCMRRRAHACGSSG